MVIMAFEVIAIVEGGLRGRWEHGFQNKPKNFDEFNGWDQATWINFEDVSRLFHFGSWIEWQRYCMDIDRA
jgi:hypothetical protein